MAATDEMLKIALAAPPHGAALSRNTGRNAQRRAELDAGGECKPASDRVATLTTRQNFGFAIHRARSAADRGRARFGSRRQSNCTRAPSANAVEAGIVKIGRLLAALQSPPARSRSGRHRSACRPRALFRQCRAGGGHSGDRGASDRAFSHRRGGLLSGLGDGDPARDAQIDG